MTGAHVIEERLEESAVLALTAEGEAELSEPGTTLSAEQLEVLVLMDGQCTFGQLSKRARRAAKPALRDNLQELIARNLVRVLAEPGGTFIEPGDFFTLKAPAPAPSVPGAQAGALADADLAFLRRNGYCVNIARRGESRERPDGRNLSVLIVDDDPDIGALLRKYLKLEGLDTRTVATGAEIEAALRRSPPPDLVLLDIGLANLDGFHVLAKMRQHPVLRKVPVIMLTATANREVVLKGILAGADGHVTKPFRIHPMVRAVKAVLGLDYDPNEQDWDRSL